MTSDLATLTDKVGTAGVDADTITVNATDSFGNGATAQMIDVTAAAKPAIATVSAQAIGINQTHAITVGTVTEPYSATSETFTVTLTDTHGDLSASGGTISNLGHTVTIANVSLSQLNSDLASLTDKDATAGTDNITMTVTDSFGNTAQQTIDVAVAGLPVITAASPQAVAVGQSNPIAVSLSETDTSGGETFTVTLTDTSNGDLSATGTGVSGSAHDLVITGTLSQVQADLATLKDTVNTSGVDADTITVSATDSFGNSTATPTTVDVTALSGPTGVAFTLDSDGGDVSSLTGGNHLTRHDTIGTFAATGDTTGASFIYSLSGANAGSFSLNANTGVLTVDGSNVSTTGLYQLSVTATDQAGLSTTQQPFDIWLGTSGSNTISNLVTTDGDASTPTIVYGLSGNDSFTTGAMTADVWIVAGSGGSSGTLTVNGTGMTGNLTVVLPGAWVSGDSLTGGSGTSDTLILNGSNDTDNLKTGTFTGFEDITLGGSNDTLTLTDSSLRVTQTGTTENIALGAGIDTVVIPSGGTPVTIGGLGNNGTISGYDSITNFATSTDFLNLAGTPVAAANTSGRVNGNNSVLEINSEKVSYNSITNGFISFYAASSGSAFSLNSTANVAAVVQYLEANDLGNAGTTVAFTATINTVTHTYIYEQVGSTPNSTNDILVDLPGVTVSNLTSLIGSGNIDPAGVAGSPVNLALANPRAAGGGPVAVTVAGVPSNWSLNQGTNNGNGTWTVATDDLSALTVLTAAAYTGAMLLNVTETWANADGSTGIATIADNIEAYAPGNPIFALAGDDNLTGAGGNDLFVFAQPIGNDTIYDFNAASDRIDLTGFAGIASFGDIAANVAGDGNGDAVITLGAGETITLHGVDAASLTAADFVFDLTPTVDNAGTMTVSDGAMLPLGGTIDNTGTIALNSTGDATELQIIGAGLTLEGGGQVILSDSSENMIAGTNADTTLTNVDNTISGAGQIGAGDGNLTLANEAAGTIDADYADGTLTIDTGHSIANHGTLEASNGGTLLVDDAVTGGGNVLIEGGVLQFAAAADVGEITFNNGTGTLPAYGEVIFDDPAGVGATVNGFAGMGPNLSHSDGIELAGTWTTDSGLTASGGILTVDLVDEGQTATLSFDDFSGTLHITTVGGNTLITDPPAASPSSSSVSIGGPGDDNFIFHPGLGGGANSTPWHGDFAFENSAHIETVQQLQSLVTSDVHERPFMDFGHHDSIALPDAPTSHWAAALQTAVHLH